MNDIFDEHTTITHGMLNRHYGDSGRTFKTLEEAEGYADGRPRARIYPLWDQRNGGRFRVGYLVSIEPVPKADRNARFSGKARAVSNYD